MKNLAFKALGALLLLCLFQTGMAQSEAQAGDEYIHLQKDDKERVIPVGDLVFYKVNGIRKSFSGTLEEINGSQITVDHHRVDLSRIKKIGSAKKKPYRKGMIIGITLAFIPLTFLPFILIRLINWMFPSKSVRERLALGNVIHLTMSLSGFLIAGLTAWKARMFRMKKWKLSVRRKS